MRNLQVAVLTDFEERVSYLPLRYTWPSEWRTCGSPESDSGAAPTLPRHTYPGCASFITYHSQRMEGTHGPQRR